MDKAISGVAFLLGVFLLEGVSSGIGPIAAGTILLVLGFAITALLGGGKYEYRNYFLSFGLCALVAGCAQQYSMLSLLTTPVSTTDAKTFEAFVLDSKLQTIAELEQVVNAPLPVYVWKALYRFSQAMGLGVGPWLGVLFNTMLVAISGVLTTKAAKAIFGEDDKRLRRVGNLYALCGLCLLLGALLLRDCFALLLNAMVFWCLINVLLQVLLLGMWLLQFSC